MLNIFTFDLRRYTGNIVTYAVILALLCFGIFTGNKANLSVGDGIFLNAPYSIGFMTGMLSLIQIFIVTILAWQLLFKEWDNRFDALLFTTPLLKKQFVAGRLLALFTISFVSFLVFFIGFIAGQNMRTGPEMQQGFQIGYYLYPLLLFGFINTLLVCSILSCIAWSTKNKLLAATGGLLLYIIYMVTLLFSNSPFMAQSMPQSLAAQKISALLDPFGLSAYFITSNHFTVAERNNTLVPLSGYLLVNRLLTVAVAALLFLLSYKCFSFSSKQKNKKPAAALKEEKVHTAASSFTAVHTQQNFQAQLRSLFSFVKTDLLYIFKSTSLVIVTLLLLFSTSMEMYAEIEKGIRMPQKYASAGLMATTISSNFHLAGAFIAAYFINDIYWRSKAYRFYFIENSTFYAGTKFLAHVISGAILLVFFSAVLIAFGVAFQLAYQYPVFDFYAYAGVFIFTTLPLILFTGLLVLINRLLPNKYVALAVSLTAIVLLVSPVANKIIPLPVLRFFSGYTGEYSDFCGYGPYISSFVLRHAAGAFSIAALCVLYQVIKAKKNTAKTTIAFTGILAIACIFVVVFLKGYVHDKERKETEAAVQYEKMYRKYQLLPQPAITAVKTQVALYPSQQAYTITGQYTIKNKSNQPISQLLLNFNEDFIIKKATYISNKENITITKAVTAIQLAHALLPNDTALLDFEISYEWDAVNGHHPLNTIIANGSFMRISRYYPQIGYQAQRELSDETERRKYNLGVSTPLKKLEDTVREKNNFINLDMIISTEENQTAIGTGALIKQWREGKRNYFQYQPGQPVPFRFAVSSAVYKKQSVLHNGISINIYYHPQHFENVQHLITNAKLTLDYCEKNFGAYPFRSVSFAEVSSFTKGFAATAYPGTIFMTEQMVFHANINAGKQEDVINELAGHELSHLWWGGNQIVPDEREGAPMLTETLAMYTEMMIYKRLYGTEKMKERLQLHQQIYTTEKGFTKNQPLFKVTGENSHISYSKGAVCMVALTDLIGEDKVNFALQIFLLHHKYPQSAPVSTDLIEEFLKVSSEKHHAAIKKLFMEAE